MFKVIITGGKDFDDMELMTSKLDKILSQAADIEICITDRRGAEKCAKRYAKKKDYKLRIFDINWNKGRNEGARVAREMMNYADAIVIFDNDDDTYSASMIKHADYSHMQKRVVRYEKKELWSQKPATEAQLSVIATIRSQNLRAPVFNGTTVAEAGLYIRKWA